MVTAKRHPHAFTLELLRLAINALPPSFSAVRRREYEARLEKFVSAPDTDYDEIHWTIAELGRESWAVRKAYEDFYARYGRASEEAHLLANLDDGIREKFERFVQDGGKLNALTRPRSADDLMKPSPFERYFTPEEKYAIGQALIVARESARFEIDELVTKPKHIEYAEMVADYEDARRDIEAGIQELKKLAGISKRWRGTIMDKVKSFEEGWSVVESGLDNESVRREVEHWKGVLEAFLVA